MKSLASTITVFMVIATLVLSGCGTQPAAPTAAPATQPPQPVAPTAAPATQPPQPVAPTAAPAQTKQLVVANDFENVTLDPAHAYEDVYMWVGKAMYDQLTQLDATQPGKILPLLADKWDISPDGLVYTFYLHKGVKFQTGREMTSADVKFSLERLQNVKGNPSFFMDGVKTVEAVDPYTVKFTLAAPDASFLTRTSVTYMHVLDSETAKAQGCTNALDADKTDKCQAYLDDHSLGTGPFILDKWVRNQEIRLVANQNYWRGKPAIDAVDVKKISDPTTQSQMLQRGDIDLAMNIDPDTAKQLKSVPNMTLVQGQGPSLIYIGLTTVVTQSQAISNKKVRQAIEYAIDYDGLDNEVLSGYAVTPPSVIPIGYLAADAVPPIKRDLAKAKSLLTDAGYPNGVDVDLTYPNHNMFGVGWSIIAQKVQADLAEAGIRVKLVPQELSIFLQGYRGKQDSFVFGWQTPDFPDPYNNAQAFGATDGVFAKRMSYVNPDNDKLLAQSIATTDPDQRKAIYAKLMTNMQDDAVFLPLVQPKESLAYRNVVQGFVYDPVVKVVLYQISKP